MVLWQLCSAEKAASCRLWNRYFYSASKIREYSGGTSTYGTIFVSTFDYISLFKKKYKTAYITATIALVRVKENFEISLLEEMDEYSQRLNRDRRVYAESNQRFTILRCYSHLIDQINMFSQTLGKDGKFQLFICLAARWA